MQIQEIILLIVVTVGGIGLLIGYIFYPLFLLLSSKRRSPSTPISLSTSATLIIPAWEERELSKKISNTLSLDRNGIDLQIIVITDEYPPSSLSSEITWITESTRAGKSVSINRAMEQVKTPFVIFTDANTFLKTDALQHLLHPFTDQSVGAVSGEKRVRSGQARSVGEQLYWRYESFLKQSDASSHSVIGGAGELFAIRTLLFESLPQDCLLDDLEISWQVIRKGYRIAYAPSALATESASANLHEESKRKIRMAAGAYQFLDRHSLKDLFSVSPVYAMQFMFRKWFRWVLAPIFLFLLLLGMIGFIFFETSGPLLTYFAWVLGGFWSSVLIGWGLQQVGVRISWLEAPFYFLFMHYCQIRGWLRYRFGKQSSVWEKSERASLP
jgi:cellulose synthase/poly-beta-1,6-N-acetylglucosamine synthase-like glycosyltransferase